MRALLYGAQAAWPIDPLLRLELTALARIARGSHVATDAARFSQARDSGETYTASLRASGDHKGWKYAAEGAYQLGHANGASATCNPRPVCSEGAAPRRAGTGSNSAAGESAGRGSASAFSAA